MKTATAHTNNTSLNIPFADDASIIKYEAKYSTCTCPDFTHRGGSYMLKGERVCKHMARQRSDKALVGTARSKARHQYEAKLVEKAASQLIQIEAHNPSLDPGSCGAELPRKKSSYEEDEHLAWLSYIELQPDSDFETFFAFEFH